jgi:hypothetical protein
MPGAHERRELPCRAEHQIVRRGHLGAQPMRRGRRARRSVRDQPKSRF